MVRSLRKGGTVLQLLSVNPPCACIGRCAAMRFAHNGFTVVALVMSYKTEVAEPWMNS